MIVLQQKNYKIKYKNIIRENNDLFIFLKIKMWKLKSIELSDKKEKRYKAIFEYDKKQKIIHFG